VTPTISHTVQTKRSGGRSLRRFAAPCAVDQSMGVQSTTWVHRNHRSDRRLSGRVGRDTLTDTPTDGRGLVSVDAYGPNI
jgi:hypothetical protein